MLLSCKPVHFKSATSNIFQKSSSPIPQLQINVVLEIPIISIWVQPEI